MADEKNMELNDEVMEEAIGGDGWDDERKPSPKFKRGDRVYRKGFEYLGDAKVRKDPKWKNERWEYDLNFFNNNTNQEEEAINQKYGYHIPESQLYR